MFFWIVWDQNLCCTLSLIKRCFSFNRHKTELPCWWMCSIVCAPTLFPLMSEQAPVRPVRTKPTDGGHTLNVATHMWQYKERPPVCTLNIKAKFFSKRQKVSVISLQSAGEFPPLLPTLSSPPPSLRLQRLWCVRRSRAVRFVYLLLLLAQTAYLPHVMRHEEQIGRFCSRMPCLCSGLTKDIIRSNSVVYIHWWHPIVTYLILISLSHPEGCLPEIKKQLVLVTCAHVCRPEYSQ